jgi:hypothetical protein
MCHDANMCDVVQSTKTESQLKVNRVMQMWCAKVTSEVSISTVTVLSENTRYRRAEVIPAAKRENAFPTRMYKM